MITSRVSWQVVANLLQQRIADSRLPLLVASCLFQQTLWTQGVVEEWGISEGDGVPSQLFGVLDSLLLTLSVRVGRHR